MQHYLLLVQASESVHPSKVESLLNKGWKEEATKSKSSSNENIKNSYRSYKNIDEKIKVYSKNLPLLKNDTENIIEYVKQTDKKKKKKFNFWKLLEND